MQIQHIFDKPPEKAKEFYRFQNLHAGSSSTGVLSQKSRGRQDIKNEWRYTSIPPYITSWRELGPLCLCLGVKYEELYLVPPYGCTDFSGFKSKMTPKTVRKSHCFEADK